MQVINIPRLTNGPKEKKGGKKNNTTISNLFPVQKKRQRTDLSPAKSPMFVDWAIDAPRDAAEPPKVGDDGNDDERKDDRLCALREAARSEDKVVEHMGGHEDSKVERRELYGR